MNRFAVAARRVAARALVASIVTSLAVACSGIGETVPPASVEPSAAHVASAQPTVRATLAPTPAPVFPTAAFADISIDPVSEATAAKLQASLDQMAAGGMVATVMTTAGTWSGATGMADGVRDVTVNDQFAINSITKSVVAAQVMQLVEAGELALDNLAADRLPPDIVFDTNGATIRHLLGMRSGIPDYDNESLLAEVTTDRLRRWTPAELLARVGPTRLPAGGAFAYSSTNYLLLGLIIEQVHGRPLAEVLRQGVLRGNGLERLIFQPDEALTDSLAMPGGALTATLEERGGYLPSMAEASAGFATFAMASDSGSLARWWRALCAGEIVSKASLTAMTTYPDADRYGLGLFDVAEGYALSVGHAGWSPDYVSWAGCMPDDGSVVVVLANSGEVDDIGAMARPLVEAAGPN